VVSTPPVGKAVKYCDEHICARVCVCLSVCLRAYLQNCMSNRRQILVHAFYVRGSDLLQWRRCDMLCTSGFMDDVMFVRDGQE